MDQTIINWLFAGFGASVGWLLKIVWDAIKELKTDMKQIERDLPEIYVRRDDFREAIANNKEAMQQLRTDVKDGFNKIDATLGLIFKRLESKEDKE